MRLTIYYIKGVKSMFKKPPERKLGEIGLNSVKLLTGYIKSIRSINPSVEYFETQNRREFQNFLDKSFQSVIDSEYKEIIEITGDSDFIRDEKRQELYKMITSNGVNMRMMMDIEPWTIQNAEILYSAGVELKHMTTPEHYHFGGWGRKMMFTLYRVPASEKSEKIVSKEQREEDVNYDFLATNQPDFVKFVNKLWEDLWKNSVSYNDQTAMLSKNKESQNVTSQLLGS